MKLEQKAIEQALKEAERFPALPADGVRLVRADALTPTQVRWLWNGWLALGKLAILAGAPGTGKTTCALGMAAIVTAGTCWPDGTRCASGDVLIWSGEDDATDTLLPRLLAAGADLRRVYFVGDTVKGGEAHPFDPGSDTRTLLGSAREIPELRFILVDPVVSAITGDSHKNTEVRRGLQPLVDFAAETGAALVGITHFSKGGQGQDPSLRVTGSIAFSAVARVVMVCAKTKNEEGNERRVLVRSKSNLGPDDGGFTYRLEQFEAEPGISTSRAVWGDAVKGTARDLIAEPSNAQDPLGPWSEAGEFLRERLALGMTPSKNIRADAKEAGIPWITVRRAFKKIGGRTHKGGMNDGWYWSLPDAEGARNASEETEDAHSKTVSTFEHLRHEVSTFDEGTKP